MKDEKQVRAANKAGTIARVYEEENKNGLYNQRQKKIVGQVIDLLHELKTDLES